MIFIVKYRFNNIAYTKRPFQRLIQLKYGLTYIVGYAIDICIFYCVCFGRQCYLVKNLVAYNQAKFHHLSTFGWRDIAFRIWCLPCNSHRSKWTKTFWVVYGVFSIFCKFNSSPPIVLPQCLIIVNWTLGNSLQWNFSLESNSSYSGKCSRIYRLQNGGHCVQGKMG